MTEAETFELLKQMEFFQGFREEHLEKLAAIGSVVQFGPRETVFQQDQFAKFVYVIVSGQVGLAVCDQHKSICREISVIGHGELMGWSPIVNRPRLFDSARTRTPVKAIRFEGSALRQLCEQDKGFGYEFISHAAHVLAHRLGDTRLQLLEQTGLDLPEFALESD